MWLFVMSSEPYLSVINVECSNVCLLCNNRITNTEASQKIISSSLLTLKDKAERWSLVILPRDDIFIQFKYAKERIENCNTDASFNVHSSCRTNFRTKLEKRIEKYGVVDVECEIPDSNDANKEDVLASPPSSTRSKVPSSRYICFVCNKVTDDDGNMYNHGGLGSPLAKNISVFCDESFIHLKLSARFCFKLCCS